MKKRAEKEVLDELERYARKLKITEEDLDPDIHDLKDEEAADINTGGLRSQLTYMLSCYSTTSNPVEAVKEFLRRASP